MAEQFQQQKAESEKIISGAQEARKGIESQIDTEFAGEKVRQEQRIAEREPLIRDFQSTVEAPMPAMPKTQDITPFQPRQVGANEAMNFGAMAMGFAALASLGVRGGIASALNGAAGAMKGYSEGNIAQAKLEMEQHDQTMKTALAQNKKMMDEYNAVMQRRDLSLNEKTQLLRVIASRDHDEAGLAALRMGQLKHFWDRNTTLVKETQQIAYQWATLQQQAYDHAQQRAATIEAANIHARAAQSRVESRPIFIELPGGVKTQLIPQFDANGQLTNLPPGAKVIGTSGAALGGALNARYAFNIVESATQASTDLLNVAMLPAGTALGALAGMTGQSGDTLKASLTNTLARKMTDTDVRFMQQLVSGLEQNMSRALGGGYASSSAAHMVQAYKEQMPRAGDSTATTAMFLARVKQELKVLNQTFGTHPGANDGWRQQMNDYAAKVDAAIPYSVADVVGATRKGRQTIGEKFYKLATQPVSQQLPTESAVPTGLPEGSRKIGKTPDGKDVWSSPDGRKWTE